MLSADSAIQFPGDLQSYNRYSYVQNNPLRFVDPSGFLLENVQQVGIDSTEQIVEAARAAPGAGKIIIVGAVVTGSATAVIVAINGGIHAYEAHQEVKRTANELRDTQERMKNRGIAPNPAEKKPLTATPAEVKIDKGAIQSNGQGDTVKPNQAPTQDAKSPAPKPDEKPSSKELRKNLDKDGRPVGKDEAAHHIVAGSDQRAAESRALLAEAGIGINAAANGVGLPQNTASPNPDGKAVHSTLHTDEYHAQVTDTLRETAPEDREAALRAMADQLEKNKKK